MGTSVGGGTELAPDALPGDGLAEVVVSFAVAPLRRLRYALHLTRGSHTDLDDVVRARAKVVTVRGARHSFGTNADGEMEDDVREQTWTCVPGAYLLRVPAHPEELAGSSATTRRAKGDDG